MAAITIWSARATNNNPLAMPKKTATVKARLKVTAVQLIWWLGNPRDPTEVLNAFPD